MPGDEFGVGAADAICPRADIIAEMELRRRALELLACRHVAVKVAGVRALPAEIAAGCAPDPTALLDGHLRDLPGRPDLPRLVAPTSVPQRSAFTAEGRAALLHAVAHIEFNAINLALDALWRFAQMPIDYYRDWARVAAEEALHFSLVEQHLRSTGHWYGEFEAHDGLWAMVERTAGDVVARMALVPRTLEARGLDVTPAMRAKFAQAGDAGAAEILDVILRDEIGHVAIGNRWYHWLCVRDRLDPLEHAGDVARQHRAPRPRPPFNRPARLAAGFTERELDELERPATSLPPRPR